MPEFQQTDYLVVGSGIAGLWYALRVSSHGSVLVITKKNDAESATNYAQGGIAAAVAEDDSPERHANDTTIAGMGLAHPDVVKMVTESGPGLVRELYEIGVHFSTYLDAKGRRRFDLGREGGHHRRRILHAADYTGMEIERGLLQAVRATGRVRVSEEHFAVDLLVGSDGCCLGAGVLNTVSGELGAVRARATMLATGGVGQAYLHTTNPQIATGDGIAMGFRAGARVANMEFVQFHPTSLYGSDVGGRAFLVTEALRGEGALLRTSDGQPFMGKYHPDGALAPRDVVARSAHAEMRARGDEYVLLDATHLPPSRLRERFPNVYRNCLEHGIDMTSQPIPVVPAAHYACGGLQVNDWGETSLPGLFAAGECACSGLHGANRLASNSLLEALVFADRAARRAAVVRRTAACGSECGSAGRPVSGSEATAVEEVRRAVRELMWHEAGIVRRDTGLRKAAERLGELENRFLAAPDHGSVQWLETRNTLTVARLVVACARRRPESRGLHYNEDHPVLNESLVHDTVLTQDEMDDGSEQD